MPTAPFSKQVVLWGDSRITANITEAEAFRFDVDMDKLWLTVYATSPAQITACNDWMTANRVGCYTA